VRRWLLLTLLVGQASTVGAESLPPAAQRLYERAQAGRWTAEARRLAPAILPTADGRSFVVVWTPSNAPERWVVSLHGSRGFATDDLAIWHRHLASRGIGLIALQWWLGERDGPHAYYSPEQIHAQLDLALRRTGVRPGSALLHGFSRGSANIYAVAALDATKGGRLFSLFVANAGGVALDYPPTRAVTQGAFGPRPLAHTRWVTVCGERDPHPERDGCPAMRRTAGWLREQGAEVVAAIEDPQGDHGVLHRSPRNVGQVLGLFAGIAR
jgi:hypothetical protein